MHVVHMRDAKLHAIRPTYACGDVRTRIVRGTERPRTDALLTSCAKIAMRQGSARPARRYVLSRMGYSAERWCARGACIARRRRRHTCVKLGGQPRHDRAQGVIAAGTHAACTRGDAGNYVHRSAAYEGMLSTEGMHRARSAPGHAMMRGPAYARVTGARGRLMTGGEPHDTLGMRETGAFEGRDSAANPGGVCARRCRGRRSGMERRRRPDFPDLCGLWAPWHAQMDALSNSSIGVAEWREKAACAGRGGLGTSGIWWSCQPYDVGMEENEDR
ncbi:hypothetical protein C8R44DRAFT_910048 [Mycena epipterygia]|nr:hypothetical protein C8R44DRAFT_910048 [Mycena epipterygia]